MFSSMDLKIALFGSSPIGYFWLQHDMFFLMDLGVELDLRLVRCLFIAYYCMRST